MNNNDDKRFEKLYELLGDEVNNIYSDEDKNSNNVDNNNSNQPKQDNNANQNVNKNNQNNNNQPKQNNNIGQNVNKNNNLNQNNQNNNNQPKQNNNIGQNVDKNIIELEHKQESESIESKKEDNHNTVTVNNTDEDRFVIMPQPVTINNVDNNTDNNTNEVNKEESNKPIDNKDIVRNVVLIDKDFDPEDPEFSEYKKSFKDILINKKFLLLVFILIFICVCIVVIKAFYYGKKVDHYEEFFTTIESKEEEFTIVYDDKEMDSETLKKVAASELVNCINSKIDENKLPDNIKNVVNEINDFYNQSYDYFSFLYRDIYTGFTVSYNQNQNIFTASTIKGPTDLYIYEMASQGKVNLDEKLTYTGAYYNTGSGVLKNKPINTKYSVRTLLEYSTVHSDNAAHNMLMDKYGRENMLNFWYGKGTTAIFTANNNWGVTNAHDASIYMQELYRFYVNDNEYGEAVMKNFMNANPKFISGKNNYIVANKSGWSGTAIHDVSIIFADNPYIVVGLSNLGETDYYMSYFYKVNDLAYKLHTEYWKYKMEQCKNIKQY